MDRRGKKTAKLVEAKEEEKKGKTLRIVIRAHGEFSVKGFYPERPDKPNQDSVFFHDTPFGLVFGIADGHGYYGEQVSQYISTMLSSISLTNLPRAFTSIHDNLVSQGIDGKFSGSTLSLALFTDKLVIANVGDSHIILFSNVSTQKKNIINWQGRLISKLHTPADREEASRIGKCGGRITLGKPNRVWLRDQDVPGLAITRSIGDTMSNLIGVIPEPYVAEIQLSPMDKCLVICSDGVTDVEDYKSISKTCLTFYNGFQAQAACERIVRNARKKWTGENIDDVSCVVAYFDAQSQA